MTRIRDGSSIRYRPYLENCIVDASIFVAIVLCSHLVLVGLVGSVGVGVCVRAVSVPCCGVSLSGVSFWRRLGRGMAVGCVCGGGKL